MSVNIKAIMDNAMRMLLQISMVVLVGFVCGCRSIILTSDPSEADVINQYGVSIGVTPINLGPISAQPFVIEKDGYVTKSIMINSDTPNNVRIELEKTNITGTAFSQNSALRSPSTSLAYSAHLKPGSVVNVRVLVVGKKGIFVQGKRISDSGTIEMPLIGKVVVNGMTFDQLGEKLAMSYRDYFDNPRVDVEFVPDNIVSSVIKTPASTVRSKLSLLTPSTSTAKCDDVVIQLKRLGELRDSGELSQQEYEIQRKALIDAQ